VLLVSAWGATETAPLVINCHCQAARCGCIGVPVPVPSGQKFEVRVQGPNATPRYFKRPDLTAKTFDEEGFYQIGDSVRFVDERHPEHGLPFDGRVAELFNLDSGTWVNVTPLRMRAISAFAPIAQDVVIAGHDGPSVGILIFPDIRGCAGLCTDLLPTASSEALLSRPAVRSRASLALKKLRAEGGSSYIHAAAALLMHEPPFNRCRRDH
jgi:feruloyl-CoA synthase